EFAEKILKHTVPWTVLDPTLMESAGGATLTKLPNESILVGGENPDSDTLTIAGQVASGIAGLKLEVLPHSTLPGGGSGRDSAGVFLLSELSAAFVPLGNTRDRIPVSFRAASCDYAYSGFSIEQVWDGNPATGWIVYGQETKPHFAIFEFNKLAQG